MAFEVSLSPQQQRIIAIVLALVPVSGLILIATSFVTLQIERHSQAQLLVRELSRERAVLSGAPGWHEHLTHMRSSPNWQNLFISKGAQPGAITALITSAGGKIQQSGLNRMEASGAIEIDEHVVFSADTEQLTRILQTMAGLHPVCVVRSIAVQGAGDATPGSPADPKALQIELIVATFERPS